MVRKMPRPDISIVTRNSQCVPAYVYSHLSLWVILRLIEIIWEELPGCVVFFVSSFFHVFSTIKKPTLPLERRKLQVLHVFLPCPVVLPWNSQCGFSGLVWGDCPFKPGGIVHFYPSVEVMQDRKLLLLTYLTTQKFHWCSSSELPEFPPAFCRDLGFMCLSQGSQFITGLMVLSGLQCKVRLAGSLSLEVTVWRSGKHLSVMCFTDSRMLFPKLSCMTWHPAADLVHGWTAAASDNQRDARALQFLLMIHSRSFDI